MRLDTLFLVWPFMFCGLAMLAFVAVMGYFLISRVRHDSSPQGRQDMADEAERWLVQQTTTLAPWQAGSLGDVSDDMTYWWSRVVSEKTRGTIKALSGGQPLIAFYAVWSFRTRRLFARTTAHFYEVAIQGDEVQIALNGAPLGTWRQSDGALLDAEGRQVGHAQRPAILWINRAPASWDDNWFEVVLHDQVIGSILAQRGLRHRMLGFGPKLAAIAPSTSALEPEVEQWLLGLTIVTKGWFSLQTTSVDASTP